jgi:hypothetical protein
MITHYNGHAVGGGGTAAVASSRGGFPGPTFRAAERKRRAALPRIIFFIVAAARYVRSRAANGRAHAPVRRTLSGCLETRDCARQVLRAGPCGGSDGVLSPRAVPLHALRELVVATAVATPLEPCAERTSMPNNAGGQLPNLGSCRLLRSLGCATPSYPGLPPS